ncbi:universal stress protein [Streptomyces sp. NPDC058864]
MSRPIVVGVSGSDESLAAADWAADEAALRGSELRLVNASRWQEHAISALQPAKDVAASRARGLLETTQERIRARHPSVAVTSDEVEDDPAEALLAASSDAELLAVGTHGLGTAGGFLFGSVGQEVAATSQHPVVLVRPAGEDVGRERSGAGSDRVVLGLDVRQTEDELLDFAFDYAARHEASLHIVCTWHLPALHRDAAAPGGAETGLQAALAGAMRAYRDKFPQVEVEEETVSGRAGSHLVSAAEGARLLVVGRRGSPGRGSAHIGPVTHAVIHHAPCAVAVVPHA